MHQAAAVGVAHALGHLAGEGDGGGEGQGPVADQVLQGLPRKELHHDVVALAILADVVDVHQVGVGQGGGEAGLAPEAIAQLGRGGEVGAQDLDRHRPVEQPVVAAVDLRHPPAGDQRADFVALVEDEARPPVGGHRGPV
jgi:hypothetical protein